MTPLLIGLTGRAGAGKSTVGAHLEERFAFEQIAFADPLLAGVAAMFAEAGIDGAWCTERALKDRPTTLGVSYRTAATTTGDAWRALDPVVFVRIAAAKLARHRQHGLDVVISDVRYRNEAAWLRDEGGILVRVLRHGLPTVRQHNSETDLDSTAPDAELLNYGSRATLEDQVDRLVQSLREVAR